MNKMKLFWQGSVEEFRRINWPTFSETRKLTLFVVAFSLILAVLLGAFDYLYNLGLGIFIVQ